MSDVQQTVEWWGRTICEKLDAMSEGGGSTARDIENERDVLFAALVSLMERDPHNLLDRRPCATCDYAKRAIAIARDGSALRAALAEEAEQ